jgi:hypothetical protein
MTWPIGGQLVQVACRVDLESHQIVGWFPSICQIQVGCDDHGFNVQDQDLGIIGVGLGAGDRRPVDCQLFLSILTSLTGAAASEKEGKMDTVLGEKKRIWKEIYIVSTQESSFHVRDSRVE